MERTGTVRLQIDRLDPNDIEVGLTMGVWSELGPDGWIVELRGTENEPIARGRAAWKDAAVLVALGARLGLRLIDLPD